MTAVVCLEIQLMLDATKATVQHGKGLALACPMDIKTVCQPHSKRLSKAVQLENGAWRTGIAVASDM
jgi:hypothetical protein